MRAFAIPSMAILAFLTTSGWAQQAVTPTAAPNVAAGQGMVAPQVSPQSMPAFQYNPALAQQQGAGSGLIPGAQNPQAGMAFPQGQLATAAAQQPALGLNSLGEQTSSQNDLCSCVEGGNCASLNQTADAAGRSTSSARH